MRTTWLSRVPRQNAEPFPNQRTHPMTDPSESNDTAYPGAPGTPVTDDALTDDALDIVSGGYRLVF